MKKYVLLEIYYLFRKICQEEIYKYNHTVFREVGLPCLDKQAVLK